MRIDMNQLGRTLCKALMDGSMDRLEPSQEIVLEHIRDEVGARLLRRKAELAIDPNFPPAVHESGHAISAHLARFKICAISRDSVLTEPGSEPSPVRTVRSMIFAVSGSAVAEALSVDCAGMSEHDIDISHDGFYAAFGRQRDEADVRLARDITAACSRPAPCRPSLGGSRRGCARAPLAELPSH